LDLVGLGWTGSDESDGSGQSVVLFAARQGLWAPIFKLVFIILVLVTVLSRYEIIFMRDKSMRGVGQRLSYRKSTES
jgi:hypothetical protein